MRSLKRWLEAYIEQLQSQPAQQITRQKIESMSTLFWLGIRKLALTAKQKQQQQKKDGCHLWQLVIN